MIRVKFRKLSDAARSPVRAYDGDAGFDLIAARVEWAGDLVVCWSDIAVEMPAGYAGFLFPRSSICDTPLSLSNAVGVIDSGYRGNIGAKFRLESFGNPDRIYQAGDRFGQLVFLQMPGVTLVECDTLADSARSVNGYGSSGR